MFNKTIAVGEKILTDLKRVIYIYGITARGFYLIYLIYAICVGAGNLIANLILSVLSVAYLVFEIIRPRINVEHAVDTAVKRTYAYLKLGVKAVTLGMTLYGIHIASTHVTTASVLLAASTALAWIFGVILEIVKAVYDHYFAMLKIAINEDLKNIPIVRSIPAVKKLGADSDSDSPIASKVEAIAGKRKDRLEEEKSLRRTEKRIARKEKLKSTVTLPVRAIKGIFSRKASAKSAEELPTEAREKDALPEKKKKEAATK